MAMEAKVQEFHGGCHCGDVTYSLRWPAERGPLFAKCGCTFCTKHAVIYTGHRDAALAVTVKKGGSLTRYKFGTETAWCHFCARCCVYLFATSAIDGREYAVINANSLANFVPPADVKAISLEGEATPDRLARRRRTWIADVTVTHA